jgi:hypothetical protein
MDLLSLLFAALAAGSALIAIASARKCVELRRSIGELCKAVSAERGRIATHDVELDRITDALRKLSGRMYAEKSRNNRSNGEAEEVSNVNRLTWKAQMREKYGITPTPRN